MAPNLTYLVEANVVCVPGNDGHTQIAGQLKKVLSRGGIAAPYFRVGHVQNGGHVLQAKCSSVKLSTNLLALRLTLTIN